MGFTDSIRTCLQLKYATFQGRASRSEYWYFMLFVTLVAVVLGGIGGAIAGSMGAFDGTGDFSFAPFIPVILFYIAVFIPIIAVGVRRLHDRDMSGWWYLGMIVLSQIPFVGIVVSIGWLVINCLKGTEGENRFGRDPLGAEHSADVFS